MVLRTEQCAIKAEQHCVCRCAWRVYRWLYIKCRLPYLIKNVNLCVPTYFSATAPPGWMEEGLLGEGRARYIACELHSMRKTLQLVWLDQCVCVCVCVGLHTIRHLQRGALLLSSLASPGRRQQPVRSYIKWSNITGAKKSRSRVKRAPPISHSLP